MDHCCSARVQSYKSHAASNSRTQACCVDTLSTYMHAAWQRAWTGHVCGCKRTTCTNATHPLHGEWTELWITVKCESALCVNHHADERTDQSMTVRLPPNIDSTPNQWKRFLAHAESTRHGGIKRVSHHTLPRTSPREYVRSGGDHHLVQQCLWKHAHGLSVQLCNCASVAHLCTLVCELWWQLQQTHQHLQASNSGIHAMVYLQATHDTSYKTHQTSQVKSATSRRIHFI